MYPSFRLIDFNITQENDGYSSDEEAYGDKKKFIIQIFGINEKGETFSIIVNDFKPFFYVKIDDKWKPSKKNAFIEHIKEKIGKYYGESVCEEDCKIIKRKKLNGFDGGKYHTFLILKFKNTQVLNKVKNLWYNEGKEINGRWERRLKQNGYFWGGTMIQIYESFIPPLLRYFHINKISPSGWVTFKKKPVMIKSVNKTTTCTYEYIVSSKDLLPQPNKEAIVPIKYVVLILKRHQVMVISLFHKKIIRNWQQYS